VRGGGVRRADAAAAETEDVRPVPGPLLRRASRSLARPQTTACRLQRARGGRRGAGDGGVGCSGKEGAAGRDDAGAGRGDEAQDRLEVL
jgi:hypothetical protein